MKLKQAVVIVVPIDKIGVICLGDEPRVLSCTRRYTTDRWGIPGGKVDAGETPAQAAVREVKEEVGLELNEVDLVPMYSGVCPGEQSFWVTAYLYTGMAIDISTVTPEPHTRVDALSLNFLTRPENSPFADYNKELAKAYFEFLNAGSA